MPTSVVLRHHWTQQQAAKAMGVSRTTLWWWCQPRKWRPALLAPDPAATAAAGQLMYRIVDVTAAEQQQRQGRAMRKPARTATKHDLTTGTLTRPNAG